MPSVALKIAALLGAFGLGLPVHADEAAEALLMYLCLGRMHGIR